VPAEKGKDQRVFCAEIAPNGAETEQEYQSRKKNVFRIIGIPVGMDSSLESSKQQRSVTTIV
jgi:hypothetical protein